MIVLAMSRLKVRLGTALHGDNSFVAPCFVGIMELSVPTSPGRVAKKSPTWPPPLPTPDPTLLELRELDDLQGNILAGFNKSHQTLLFLTLPDRAKSRAWLSDLRPSLADNKSVTRFNSRFSKARRQTGSDPEGAFAVWTNVSFTASGIGVLAPKALAALDTIRPDLDPSLAAWIDGANDQAITNSVGDTAEGGSPTPNDPSHWLFGSADGARVDAVLLVAADRVEDLSGELGKQRDLLARHRVTIAFEQDGAVLPGLAAGHEHFGFKDGISQPGVLGYDEPDPAKPTEVKGKPGTDLIPAGVFILGYPRGDGAATRVPLWMFNGSFLVTRRLAQDVPAFWSGVERQHEAISDPTLRAAVPTADALAARLVGRWRSGTPTDQPPTLADHRAGRDPDQDNNFDFQDDPDGLRTPKCAHIRKVYPRAGANPPISEEATEQHRIIRRGIPFGQTFQPTAGRGEGVDAERGLLFQCYQSSLTDGFIFIQEQWVNNPSFPKSEVGNDAVIGLKTTLQIPVTTAVTQKLTFEQFVRTEGTVFSITPSLSTIDKLARGAALPFA